MPGISRFSVLPAGRGVYSGKPEQTTEYGRNESEQEFMKGCTTAGVLLCELFFQGKICRKGADRE